MPFGRARRTVIVLDDGSPRNAAADGVHNYLTRDGVPPAALLTAGRKEAEQYGALILRAGSGRTAWCCSPTPRPGSRPSRPSSSRLATSVS
ncbi:MAG: hypothetical protein ACRDNF_23880 [Streptosporangiaceae bacterium]